MKFIRINQHTTRPNLFFRHYETFLNRFVLFCPRKRIYFMLTLGFLISISLNSTLFNQVPRKNYHLSKPFQTPKIGVDSNDLGDIFESNNNGEMNETTSPTSTIPNHSEDSEATTNGTSVQVNTTKSIPVNSSHYQSHQQLRHSHLLSTKKTAVDPTNNRVDDEDHKSFNEAPQMKESTLDNTTENQSQTCNNVRDLSRFSSKEIGKLHEIALPKQLEDANCLSFDCSTNTTYCDNVHPTNYDGPEPPCCIHVMRDAARIFDEAMCDLGLDYVAAYGTLLGLRRSDRFIPWTADIDYIIPYDDVANAMVSLWNTKSTGLAHIFQDINRVCITQDFAEGKLKDKWSKPFASNLIWNSGLPYIDLYVGRNQTDNLYSEFPKCIHLHRNIFPTNRVSVYNHTLFQRFPMNPDQILRTYYGKDWRVPKADKNPHGDNIYCAFSPTY